MGFVAIFAGAVALWVLSFTEWPHRRVAGSVGGRDQLVQIGLEGQHGIGIVYAWDQMTRGDLRFGSRAYNFLPADSSMFTRLGGGSVGILGLNASWITKTVRDNDLVVLPTAILVVPYWLFVMGSGIGSLILFWIGCRPHA